MDNGLLKRILIVHGLLYKPVVVPDILRDCLLILAHDEAGDNSSKRTYNALRNLYYWKGMKKSVHKHHTSCQKCAKHNVKVHHHSLWSTSHIYDRRIPPSLKQRQQICTNSHMHANWFHILFTYPVKTCRRHCKGIPQSHMLYIQPFKENLDRQWHRIQKQTMDRGL